MSPFLTHMLLFFRKEPQDKAPVLCVLAIGKAHSRPETTIRPIAGARINACLDKILHGLMGLVSKLYLQPP